MGGEWGFHRGFISLCLGEKEKVFLREKWGREPQTQGGEGKICNTFPKRGRQRREAQGPIKDLEKKKKGRTRSKWKKPHVSSLRRHLGGEKRSNLYQ